MGLLTETASSIDDVGRRDTPIQRVLEIAAWDITNQALEITVEKVRYPDDEDFNTSIGLLAAQSELYKLYGDELITMAISKLKTHPRYLKMYDINKRNQEI